MADIATAGRSDAPRLEMSQFFTLVTGMSRFLSGISSIPLFKEGKLSLSEWVALSVLAENDGVSNKHLARSLGVTSQRANQIGEALSNSSLIVVQRSLEDQRTSVITITDAGRTAIADVNAKLEPLLSSALKDRERSLARAAKQVRLMMRIVQNSKSAKKQQGKKARDEQHGGSAA